MATILRMFEYAKIITFNPNDKKLRYIEGEEIREELEPEPIFEEI